MINREEAKKDFELQEISSGYVNSNFLDRIYDSIGSCGECKHYMISVRGHIWNKCARTNAYKESKCFCEEFERKEQ